MSLVRVVGLAIGAILMVAGIGLMAVPNGVGIGFGFYAIVFGALLVGAALLERSRYRSSQAELTSSAPGPGGGEPTDRPMDTRFRRTDERFVDPTTKTPMRVWVDPDTGERRYRAES